MALTPRLSEAQARGDSGPPRRRPGFAVTCLVLLLLLPSSGLPAWGAAGVSSISGRLAQSVPRSLGAPGHTGVDDDQKIRVECLFNP
ncbi:hypothetical protein ElyMa_000940600 [Elysia marginata]|uniref:Uncharacterized protein n=1 Tax=Elysia marginata TaxID=1093978 RepID=A0AAV4HAH8_9GAST|nr:hypothetical protein ElyMa_000940600 [Elysia marginata]